MSIYSDRLQYFRLQCLPTQRPGNSKRVSEGKVLQIDVRHCRFFKLHVGAKVDLNLDILQTFKTLEVYKLIYTFFNKLSDNQLLMQFLYLDTSNLFS
jgi:hypothetical protein